MAAPLAQIRAPAGPARSGGAWLFALPWDPRRPGGVDQVVLNLYRELAARSAYEPRLLIASWEHPEPAASVDDGRPTVRMRLRAPAGATSNPWQALRWALSLPRSLPRLARLLQQDRVAVVNVHFPGLWALQFGLVKRWLAPGLRVILSFHGLDIGTAAQTRGVVRWWWRRLLRSADALVACSEDLAAQVRAFDPAVANRTYAVHNGLDVEAFLAEEAPDCAPDPRLRGRPYVLNVAAFEPKKGLDVLIRAFAAGVAKRDPELLLVLVGVDRGIRGDLVALADSLGVGDRVLTFADVPHARLHPFYRAARVFCLPSRSEPFGLVLLEAGAFALPVVASRVGGIPEVVAHGESGRLVPPEDPARLAAELEHLLGRPDERGRLGRALQLRVREHFSWSDACARYLQLAAGAAGNADRRDASASH